MTWLFLSAVFMVLTGAAHSYFGEKRLIIPILSSGIEVAENPLGRVVIRAAWHLTTLLMVLNAAVMVWPDTPRTLAIVTASAWLVSGIVDAVISKGKHIGWPPITLAGIFGLMGSLL